MSSSTQQAPATRPRAAQRTAPVPSGDSPAPPFHLAKSETLFLDREAAVEAALAHQSLPKSPTEREMESARLKLLADRARGGVWLPCQWATVTYKGVKYRMNGQHSSQVMIDHADHLPGKVAIHLDHFEVEGPVGMGVLFRQFDARFSARSKQDVAGAYHGLVDELKGVSRRKAKLGIEGVVWYERAIEGLPVPSGDDVYEKLMANTYHRFIRWLDKVIVHGKTRELEKAPVVGAMYATFIMSESGAQDFWPHVAKADMPDDSDPRNVLSADLTAAIDPERKADPLKPGEYYHKCIKAWNAFRAGEKVRSLNVNTKKGLPDIAA
jgi:uncharacterized protein (DUF2237 family)